MGAGPVQFFVLSAKFPRNLINSTGSGKKKVEVRSELISLAVWRKRSCRAAG